MGEPETENCPTCGTPAVARCRCLIGDRTCKFGHSWHRCRVHRKTIPFSGHGTKDDGGCTCGPAGVQVSDH